MQASCRARTGSARAAKRFRNARISGRESKTAVRPSPYAIPAGDSALYSTYLTSRPKKLSSRVEGEEAPDPGDASASCSSSPESSSSDRRDRSCSSALSSLHRAP